MTTPDYMTHKGVVTQVEHNQVVIKRTDNEECHSCEIKSFCGVEDEDRNSFTVTHNDLHIGDKVEMQVSQSNGLTATFLGYVLPFLIMFSCLVILNVANFPEQWAGLIALLSLPVYYLTLTLFRGRLKSNFQLQITKT
ncbi:MAG: SoxR reducing system RseC family protein [Cyclobacteriaceae bacterium]